jgi:hypothetical protein
MTLLSTLVCLLAVSGVSLSIPVTHGTKGTFVRREAEMDGPSEYLRALVKKGINPTLPRAIPVEEHLRRRAATAVPATLTGNLAAYQAPITIGGQNFLLDFDTGSPDLWVYSTLTENGAAGNRSVYDPTKSSAVPTEDTWDIQYNDGTEASGVVFYDTVTFGGITITNQAVEAAVLVTGNILNDPSDGLLGLSPGPNTIVPDVVPTTLDNLYVSPEMGARLFTCALTRPNEPAGFFTFGYIDTELVGSVTPVYTPASSVHGYWEFASEFAEINGERYDRAGNTAYADTGTTLIMIADDLLPSIYGPIGGFFDDYYQGWIFPSNVLVGDIPTIVLPAGDGVVTLNQLDLVTPIAQNETYFYGSIQSRGDTTYDVFGDYWLRNIYAIWDFGTTSEGLRFGFVPRAA